MKIALINFYYAYNYGAVLQCLALSKKLEFMGHTVRIIQYKPYYQMQYYVSFPNPFRAFTISWGKYKKSVLSERLHRSTRWFIHTIISYKYSKKRIILLKVWIKKYFKSNS